MKLHLAISRDKPEIEWKGILPKAEAERKAKSENLPKIAEPDTQPKTAPELNFQREERIRRELKEMSWLFKVLDGQEFDPDSKIEFMTDLAYIGERSRFTRADIIRQNYLRLIALFHPELYAFRDWANFDAAHQISRDGLSRQEFVDVKRGNQHPGQLFQIGTGTEQVKQNEGKRGFLDRLKKKERGETE